MDQESHDPAQSPGCPWWCASSEYAGTPDHPARHEGHTLAVDAERPDLFPTTLHALLILPLGGRVTRILLGDGDTDLVSLSSSASRSLAAAMKRLADVVEGVVSV